MVLLLASYAELGEFYVRKISVDSTTTTEEFGDSLFISGDVSSPLMVICDAPSKESAKAGHPLAGGAGRLFWGIAAVAGIQKADCYFVNCIGEEGEGKNGAPTDAQLSKWWDRFTCAVRDFRGRHVVVLGSVALQRYTGLDGGIEGWRGYIVSPSECRRLSGRRRVVTHYKTNNPKKGYKIGDPRWVNESFTEEAPVSTEVENIFPCLDPETVLRSGFSSSPLLVADLRRVRRAMDGALRPSRDSFVEVLPSSAPDDRREISVDIETGDAPFYSIERLGVAGPDFAFSHLWTGACREYAKDALADSARPIIIHNAGFDVSRLHKAGVQVKGPLRDTLLGCAFLQPDLKKGLNSAASMYLDVPRWKHLADAEPAKYNALDAIREYELWQVLKQEMQNRGQLELFTGTLMEALPTVIRMGEVGIPISRPRQEAWLNILGEQAREASRKWELLAGLVNFNSSSQIRDMFKGLGVKLPRNGNGGESADKESLMRIRYAYPEHEELVDCLIHTRKVYKDISTYADITPLDDGRVHASFTPVAKDEDRMGKELAGTWRITAKEPNLQNQTPEARKMYVPSAGCCFVGADYSSLEARIFAYASGDSLLIEAVNDDIHSVNMARLGVDRTRAKNGFYGWGYGAGARTLNSSFIKNGYRVPIKECQALIDGFNSSYKVATSWRMHLIQEAVARRYVENPFGFKRYFPQREFPVTKVANTWIQSTGAFMVWTLLKELAEELQSIGWELLLMVHDSVLAEGPIESRDKAARVIKRHMEQVFDCIKPGFYCPVELKWSDVSWGGRDGEKDMDPLIVA